MKFTLGKYEKLIELVRAHPCLYNASLAKNNDTILRKNTWKRITAEMDEPTVSDEDWKKIWKQKRDSFMRKKRELENCPRDSVAQVASKFPLYDQMTFLIGAISGSSTGFKPELNEEPRCSFLNGTSCSDTRLSGDVKTELIGEPETSRSSPSPTTSSCPSITLPLATSLRATKRKASSSIDCLIEQLNESSSFVKKLVSTLTKEDTRKERENSNILSFLSTRMGDFPPSTQQWMEDEVMKIYMEAKTKAREEISPPS